MIRQLQRYMAIGAMAIVAILMVQCGKKTPAEPEIVKTAITNITPLQGLTGTIVSINGAAFDTTAATTSVKINGVAAVIRSLTPTQINAVVPGNATTGKITLTTKDTAIVYPTDFTVNSLTAAKIPATDIFKGVFIANIAADAAGSIYYNTNTDTVFKISSVGVISRLAIAGSGTTKLGGIAVDAAGNVYSVGTNDFKVYKITPAGAVSVMAGSGVSAHTDGAGTAAQFTAPVGMAIDVSGNLFVTDVYRVRKITPAGQVSTFAGNATAGRTDGQGTSATFGSYGNLQNIATDPAGNVYVSDGDKGTFTNSTVGTSKGYYIRKITPSGIVSSIGPMLGQAASNTGGKGPMTLAFSSLLAADGAGNFLLPGTSYNTGSTASGGCCNFAPVFTANSSLYSSEVFELYYKFSYVGMNYTSITFDPLGNLYLSALVSYGHRYYEPASMGTRGSVLLKLRIQ